MWSMLASKRLKSMMPFPSSVSVVAPRRGHP